MTITKDPHPNLHLSLAINIQSSPVPLCDSFLTMDTILDLQVYPKF